MKRKSGKRDLTRSETIDILTAVAEHDGLDRFIERIWDALGYDGHEAIKKEFSKSADFTTFDEKE